MEFISFIYSLLWGDLFVITLPNGSTIGISLLVLLLIPTGIYFTIRTKFLPIRLFGEMLRISIKKDEKSYSFDSVKLCTECAKGISVALRKFYQKSENKNEKKDS